jgi:hypothetical protein
MLPHGNEGNIVLCPYCGQPLGQDGGNPLQFIGEMRAASRPDHEDILFHGKIYRQTFKYIYDSILPME